MNKKPLRLDETDHRIIEALQKNSRKSSRQIAREVGVTHQTVIHRLRKLEKHGVIEGYTVILGPQHDYEKHLRTLTLIKLGNINSEAMTKTEEHLRKHPNITHAAVINGDFDLYIMGKFSNQAEARQKIGELREKLSQELDLHSFQTYNLWRVFKKEH